MRRLSSVFMPFWVLLGATVLGCIAGYFIKQGFAMDYPFHKVIKKATLGFLVLSIVPVMRWSGYTKIDLGFAPRPFFFKQLLQGFGLGFITLMPVIILLTLYGVNVPDQSQPWTAGWVSQRLGIELLLALLIGFFEESLFRGLFLKMLGRYLPVIMAVLISAFYFAALHFLGSKPEIPLPEMTIFSGFILLREALANMFNPTILPAFFALTTTGIFLAMLRTQFQQSLGLCIGCHAGWVWLIKLDKDFFNTDFTSPYAYLVSSYDGVIGPLVTGWMLLVVLVIFGVRWFKQGKLLNSCAENPC